MLARSALVLAVLYAFGQSVTAVPAKAEEPAAEITSAIPKSEAPAARIAGGARTKALLLRPDPAAPGDILGARGPGEHARELRQIAIATSLGNDGEAARLKAELHQFGVSREAVQDYLDRAMVHGDGSHAARKVRPMPMAPEIMPEATGWEASQ